MLLDTLNNLDTCAVINSLNATLSKRKLTCLKTLYQIDGRANRSIANELSILDAYWSIEPINVTGVSDKMVVQCTHRGVYHLVTNNGSFIPVLMHYSPQASHTIISPNDIVSSNNNYSLWMQHSDMLSGTGYVRFSNPSGLINKTVNLTKSNNLLFLTTPRCNSKPPLFQTENIINSIQSNLKYKLWHHRLAHPGQNSMDLMYKSCDSVPHLKRPPLFRCAECSVSKIHKHIKPTKRPSTRSIPGSLFHIDFGFVRGSPSMPSPSSPSRNRPLKTCRNGFNCYLLITDSATRYTWVFPTASKDSPINILDTFLTKYGAMNGEVRTDLEGELARSIKFRKLLQKHKYVLLPTAPDSSFQNRKVERQHQTLGNIMKTMLLSANLDGSY